MQWFIGSVYSLLCTYTAAILWPKSKLCLGWNNTSCLFSCISIMIVQRKYQKTDLYFFVSFTKSNVIFAYIHFTFPQTSKCFLSNGIMNMHILASGPELQAVKCGYVILGENWKKGVRSLRSGGCSTGFYAQRNSACLDTDESCIVWLRYNKTQRTLLLRLWHSQPW